MRSPLDQFENGWTLDVLTGVITTNETLGVNLLVLGGLLWLGVTSYDRYLQRVYSVVADVVRQQVATQVFHPLMVWTFIWLLISNLTGLIPGAFTVTSQLSVTLFLGLSFNVGFAVWGFTRHGLHFLKLFVPSGAPRALLPLIVVIEVVSYLIRPLSLSLRLFANMMAGHALVHILLGFVYLLSVSTLAVGLAVVFGVILLELGIALIQAYVFVVLSCIYLQDSLHPGH